MRLGKMAIAGMFALSACASKPAERRTVASAAQAPEHFRYEAHCSVTNVGGKLAGGAKTAEITAESGEASPGCSERSGSCDVGAVFTLSLEGGAQRLELRFTDKESEESLLLKGETQGAVKAAFQRTVEGSFSGERLYTDAGPSVIKQAVSRFHGHIYAKDANGAWLTGAVACQAERVTRVAAFAASQYLAKPCVPDVDSLCAGSDTFTAR